MIRASLLVVFVAGCGPEPAPTVPIASSTAPTVSSGSPLERYFPLVEGNIYSYDVDTLSDHPSTGALSAAVSRTGPTAGTFRIGATTRRIQYESDGIVATEPNGDRAYLLKAPLTEGTSWLGAGGGEIRIVDAHATAAVAAGTFVECVVTEEKRAGDFPKNVTTTYCPDVGLVELSIKAPGSVQKATLKQFGPPVNIGPEGVTHTVSPE